MDLLESFGTYTLPELNSSLLNWPKTLVLTPSQRSYYVATSQTFLLYPVGETKDKTKRAEKIHWIEYSFSLSLFFFFFARALFCSVIILFFSGFLLSWPPLPGSSAGGSKEFEAGMESESGKGLFN